MAIQQTHVRSISLPSRLPSNSLTNSESLQNLKSLKNINTSLTRSEDIQSGVLKLAQLYNSVQEVNQSSASKHNFDASMELIESCDTIREMIQMVKENVQSLQSAIRRKGIESSSIQEDIARYLCFRKKMNKNLSKSLKNLKSLENKNVTLNIEHNDLVMALRETISMFKSTFMYLSCPTVGNSNWNLITKLMKKSEICEKRDQFVTSEIGRLDCVFAAKVIDEQMMQRSLQNVDSCIQGLESGVESLYREMICCRVKILNILADY